MFTLVADGAPPITINIGKGLAGACAQAKANGGVWGPWLP